MSDWKNNPAIAAIVAGSVVLTTTLLVVYNYVMPVYQQADKNTISELKIKLETQENRFNKKDLELNQMTSVNKTKINNLENVNKSLIDEIKNYKLFLLRLSLSSIFQKDQPLPIGYSKVLPGEHLGDVYNAYNKIRIKLGKNGNPLKVSVNAGGIGDVEYFTSDEDNPTLITHIFVSKYYKYYPRTDEDEAIMTLAKSVSLLDFLTENLGHPVKCGQHGNIWPSKEKPIYVFFDSENPDSYSIYQNYMYHPTIELACENKVGVLSEQYSLLNDKPND